MTPLNRVERSYDTLVACPECAAAVNASLEVERGILDVLVQLAMSEAWDGVRAPALDQLATRLVQDYEERVQLRVLAAARDSTLWATTLDSDPHENSRRARPVGRSRRPA